MPKPLTAWCPTPTELAGIKSPSAFGFLKTAGLGRQKTKVKGEIKGGRSSAQYPKSTSFILAGEELPLVVFEVGQEGEEIRHHEHGPYRLV
jgi:hypothetical protein